MDELNKHFQEALINMNIPVNEVIFAASSDMTFNGEYKEVWLLVYKDKLITLKVDNNNDYIHLTDITQYNMKNIKNISYNHYVTGGTLVGEIDGEITQIIRFTATYKDKFGLVVKLLNKLIEGKEIEEDDYKQFDMPKYCPKCGTLYPDPNKQICPKCLDKKSLFIRVLSFTSNYKFKVFLIVFFMMISAVLNIVRPYFEGKILFDEVLKQGGKYYGHIGTVIIIIIGLHLLSLIFLISSSRINAEVTANMIYDIKSEIFTNMQRLSMKFYTNRRTGTLMTRVHTDTSRLQYFFHDGFPYLIVNSVMLVGIVSVMLVTNWFLTLIVLIPVPIIVYIATRIFPKFHKYFTRQYIERKKMNSLINDTLTGFRVVKAFGKEKKEVSRFKEVNYGVKDIEEETGKYTSTVGPFMMFLIGIGGIVVWGVGGYQVVNGQETFGTIVSFTAYLGLLYQPLIYMTDIVRWWSNCMNSARRIFEIIDAEPDIYDIPNAIKKQSISGDIELNDVSFGYETHKPVIHDVSFKVDKGEMIGLVGHSGAGKSTLTNLITRLYDVDDGTITIDGCNVKEMDSASLRKQIGMVLQDTFLFTGTIAENIAYAMPSATREDIIRVSMASNCHDFIMKLPDAYDTVIGSKGQDLSGGQKQRIAIARALLQNPRILILDEATSSVDTETEQKIQEALERLVKGRTTIAIAHRLSTLRNADKLVVINQGKVAEMGTHEELVELKGEYYKMLEEQKEALKLKGVGA